MKLDLRRRRRRRWTALGLAFAVSLAVVAPATAKSPAFYPQACTDGAATTTEAQPSPLAVCKEGQTAFPSGGNLDGADAALLAGGVTLLVLAIGAGLLVSTHRRDAPEGRAGPVGVAEGEPV